VSTDNEVASNNSSAIAFQEQQTVEGVQQSQQQQQQQQQQSSQSGIYTIIPHPPFIVAYLKQEDPENFVESSG